MCFKGAPVLATFLCLNGSLHDQLSCIIFTCSTCTYSEIYVYISVWLWSVHLREVRGLICHSIYDISDAHHNDAWMRGMSTGDKNGEANPRLNIL